MQTILVAENNAIIRFGLTEAFSARGYCVLQAHNQAEALRVASVYMGLIHALVTDVHIPELDGHELGRELKLKRPDMQLLIVSTYNAADFAAGDHHDALLEKPINPYCVESLVKQLLLANRSPSLAGLN